MAIQLGSAYGKVSLDTKGLEQGVNKGKASLQSLETSAKRLGESLRNVGQKMTVALTVPVAAMSLQAVKLASDMVETESKVKVVFGEMTDSVMKWSEGSAKSMQLSRQEALEAASTFGNLFIAMKIGRPEAAEMSTTLVQLAGDLASINNLDPSQVLVKLKSGIVGETEAVRDLGIDLRQTTVEAKAAEMGFQALNGQFAQGDLIAARYAIILEQTKVAQGDIARTGGALAGQWRELNAQWKDALATLGKNLLPIALKIVTWLNDMLEKFNKMSPAQQKVIGGIILLVAVIGPLLIAMGTLLPMIHLGTRSLNPFSGGILGLVFGFAKLVSALAIVVKVLGFFGVSLGPVGAAIVGLNTAIAGVGSSILAFLAPLLILLLAVVAVVIQFALAWKLNLFWIRDNVKLAVNTMKLLWQAFTAFLRGDTKAAGEYLKAAWDGIVTEIKGRLERLFGWAGPALQNFVKSFTTLIGRLRDYIINAFTKTDWAQLGKFILSGIANGMLGGLPALLAVAARVAADVLARIKRSLGIASDSKEGIKLGFYTGRGFSRGMMAGVDPNVIANAVTRPLTTHASSQQQNNQFHFSSGLTLREVRGMIAQNNEDLLGMITRAMAGAG